MVARTRFWARRWVWRGSRPSVPDSAVLAKAEITLAAITMMAALRSLGMKAMTSLVS